MTCSFEGCGRPVDGRGLCGGHIQQDRAGHALRPLRGTWAHVLFRFWAQVEKRNDGCWVWTGVCNPRGYGFMSAEAKYTAVHRLSWRIAHGEMPPSEVEVCHRCDNPPCVNPAHLFLGSHSDNMQDCADKGRMPRNGEQNGRAVLNADGVREIRRRSDAGEASPTIAADFGIQSAQVRKIARRESWSSVPE